MPQLGLAIPNGVIFATNSIEDPVLKAVHKYQKHPSILAIKEKYKELNFCFSCVNFSNLQDEFKKFRRQQVTARNRHTC